MIASVIHVDTGHELPSRLTAHVDLPDTAENRAAMAIGLDRIIAAFVKSCEKDAEIAADVMDNFPQCGMTVRCVGWHYMDKDEKPLPFAERWLWFEPDSEGLEPSDYVIDATMVETRSGPQQMYVVTHVMVQQALPVFRNLMDIGKIGFDCATTDPETWDGLVYDAIIQICLFGDVILG